MKVEAKETAKFTDTKGRQHDGTLTLTKHGDTLWNWHFSNGENREDITFIQLGNYGLHSRDHAFADAQLFHVSSKSIENLL